jgi:drug/metabolite transporter (DMT)-like permease
MIAVIAGLLTAIMWSISTLSSARASRRIGAPSTVAGVALVGLLATIPLLAVSPMPTEAQMPQLPWLFIAGAGNIIGLLASYGALRRGKVSVVAPISSTEGAIAAALAILAGEPATALLLTALSLVVVGVMLTAYGREDDTSDVDPDAEARRGGPVFLAMAFSAALLFGVSLYAVGHTSGLLPVAWIVAAGRVFGVLFVALPLFVTRRLRITRAALPFVVVCGLAEVGGSLTVIWGSSDSVAITAVLASQFAVITVVVSRFLGERVERHQMAGAVLTGVGVAAVTLLRI